jgi:hypothetical protein
MSASVEVSVIVPVTERPTLLVDLYEEYALPLQQAKMAFEFVFVSYPWNRHHTELLEPLRQRGAPIRVVEVAQGMGESSLLHAGAESSRGEVLCTIPAYRQTVPDVLPHLVGRVRDGADLAVACRWPRTDSFLNRAQSWLLHASLRGPTDGRLHDVACGVRAFRSGLLGELPLHGDSVRFLPLIALREGFTVVEIRASVHPASRRARIYRPGVYLRRLIDTLGLLFLLKFTEKPLRLFGLAGAGMGGLGALILGIVFLQRISGQGLADRPLLLLGVLLITVGIQLLALGLIGELIVYVTAPKRRLYRTKSTGRGSNAPQ